MSKHPSLIQEAIRRLEGLRAFGESRHALKLEQRDELRASGEPIHRSHSTGRIHSVGTASTYQKHVLAYCAWARATYGVRRLAKLDASAPELVAEWLRSHVVAGASPYTVQMQRSALRMFHQDRSLGQDVAIPRRRREAIVVFVNPVWVLRHFCCWGRERPRASLHRRRQGLPDEHRTMLNLTSAVMPNGTSSASGVPGKGAAAKVPENPGGFTGAFAARVWPVGWPSRELRPLEEGRRVVLGQLLFSDVAGLRVEGVWREGLTLHVRAATTRKRTRCPCCGRRSRRVQGFYQRTITDLARAGSGVTIHLRVRRFWCRVRRCRRRIFCERQPALAAAFARKTPRLREHLRRDALAMGGERGARHASAEGMPVSARTLLRLVRKTPLPAVGAVRVLGVDDWARRKGRDYGAILVDFEAHQVLDVLPDRTSGTLAIWLAGHPEVEVVSHDRATAFAEGIHRGAPQATEVADRFHVLQNLTGAVERVVSRHHAALRVAAVPDTAPAAPHEDAPPMRRPDDLPRSRTEAQQDWEARRARRQARYDEGLALHEQGYSQNQIACALGMGRHTIRRFLRAAGFPERAVPKPRPSLLRQHDPYLRERWAAGCDNAHELWKELQAKGYTGSESHVRHYVAAWRGQASRPGKKGPRPLGSPRRSPPPRSRVPAPRETTWLLLRDPATLTADQAAYLELLRQRCPELAAVQTLARDFQTLVRQREVAALDPWLRRAEASAAPELRGFAEGIRADYAAVAAGLTLEWSQGQVEGQVNRLKETKRAMYGRANFDLLRLRVLHPV